MCLLAAYCIIGGKHDQLTKIKNCIFLTAQGNQACSLFGDDLTQTTPASGNGVSGTFVNIPTALSCPGNATQWNVCYYRSTSAVNSVTNFGVYRLSSGTTYSLITASQVSHAIAKSALTYACTQFPISAQYVVQPGDILVVCVQTGGKQLGVVGTATTDILQNTAGCSGLPGATLDTSTNMYSTASGLTLHVSLGKLSCCVMFCRILYYNFCRC